MENPEGTGQKRSLVDVSAYVALVTIGAFSILAQTAVLREYLVVYGGSELAIGLFFGSWLAWIAVGALAAGKLASRFDPPRVVVPCLVAYALAPLVQTALVRSLRLLAGVAAFEQFPFDRLAAATLISNAPVSLLTGLLFTLGATLVTGRPAGPAVSLAYLMEAAGGFAGGLGATVLFGMGAGPLEVLLGAGAGVATIAAILAVARSRTWAVVAGAVAAVLALTLVTPAGRALERATQRQRWRTTLPKAELIESIDTPYRNVSLARLGAQRVVLFDGRIVETYPGGPGPREDAALLLAEVPQARSVLVLGATPAGLVKELLAHGVKKVTMVEPDGEMTAALLGFLPAAELAALVDPRVTIVRADPRAWLDDTSATFDLVILRAPDPDTAQLNRLYTVEFYRAVQERLAVGGAFSTRITSAQNYLGTEVERYGRSIFRSLGAVFPHVVVTPGENAVFVASREAGVLSDDPEVLATRYRSIDPHGLRMKAARFFSIMEPPRVGFVRGIYERPASQGDPVALNTDARPVAYVEQLCVMGATMDSRIPSVVSAARTAGIWLALLPIIVAFVTRLRHMLLFTGPAGRKTGNAATIAGVAGFVSISLDIVLLHAFQSRYGSLFVDVGLMNAMFMSGLALGAFAVRPLIFRTSWRMIIVAMVMALTTVTCCVLPGLVALPSGVHGFGALFGLCGAITGAAFSAATALYPAAGQAGGPSGVLASLLSGADHWGGAAGALAAGLVMLPVLGIDDTCVVLGVLSAAALVLTAVDWASMLPGKVTLFLRQLRMRSAFPWHGLGSVMAGTTLCAVALGVTVRAGTDRLRVEMSDAQIARIAPEDAVEPASDPFVHYRLSPAGKGRAGILLSSMTVASGIKGYGGPLNLAILLREDGLVDRVRLLESRETPSYVEGIGAWLSASFEGRDVRQDFLLAGRGDARFGDDHVVDVLTGATVTSRAAVGTVNEAKNAAARLLGIQVEASFGPSPWPAYFQPSVIALLVALVLSLIVDIWGQPRQSPWPRRALLALNLVLGGVVFNTQLSTEHLVRLMRMDLPSLDNAELFVLMGGAGILAVTVGPLYCSSVCPFGAAQELLSLFGLGVRPSLATEMKARYLRFVVLAVVVAGWMLTGSRSLAAADPLVHAFSGRLAGPMLLLVVVVGLLSLFSFRFWCRTFCPVGALLSLGGRVGLALGLTPAKRYRACDLGARRDRDGECLHCNRCLTGATMTPSKLRARQLRFDLPTVDRWMRIAIIGVGLILVAAVLGGSPAAPGDPTGRGKPRNVDVDRVKALIEQGDLSGEEALYWHRVQGDGK